MITVESVTKRYGDYTAVDDVTFTAQPGRVTGFLGPNGAGKSTTMRVIVGLTPPTQGAAHVLGRRFAHDPRRRQCHRAESRYACACRTRTAAFPRKSQSSPRPCTP